MQTVGFSKQLIVMITVKLRRINLTLFLLSIVVAAYSQSVKKELWGATTRGGEYNLGVIYKTNIDGGDYTVKKVFINSADDGDYPAGSLIQASNGKLYGLTSYGGINNAGVIFEIDPSNGAFKKRFDFSESLGRLPLSSLIEAKNHRLYGLTTRGGTGAGVLFEFNPENGDFQKKVDFNETTGTYPNGSLAMAANGKLYGITSDGGQYNDGVIFEFDPVDGKFLIKIDLYFGSSGLTAANGIIIANNGKLYGMTTTGGDNNKGQLFEFDPVSEVYFNKFHFDEYTTGGASRSGLMQASNGKLYGMTFAGGSAAQGTLFEYDLANNSFSKKTDFSGLANGGSPINELIELPNGKLFAPTTNGGLTGSGTLFEYTISDGVLQKKFDFVRANGSLPRGALLLIENSSAELEPQTITFEPLSDRNVDDDPFNLSASATSGLPITFTTSNPAVAMISGSQVMILGSGTTEITASQAGNDVYLPAPDVVRTLTIKLITSLEDFPKESLAIYPNPTHSEITVRKISNKNNLQLNITDLIGRKLLSTPFACDIPISTVELDPGMYIIQIFSANTLIFQDRLVKH